MTMNWWNSIMMSLQLSISSLAVTGAMVLTMAWVMLRPIIPGTRVGMSHGTMDGTVLGTGIRLGIMDTLTGVFITGVGRIIALGITAIGIVPIGDGVITMDGMATIPVGASLITLADLITAAITGWLMVIVQEWQPIATAVDV